MWSIKIRVKNDGKTFEIPIPIFCLPKWEIVENFQIMCVWFRLEFPARSLDFLVLKECYFQKSFCCNLVCVYLFVFQKLSILTFKGKQQIALFSYLKKPIVRISLNLPILENTYIPTYYIYIHRIKESKQYYLFNIIDNTIVYLCSKST